MNSGNDYNVRCAESEDLEILEKLYCDMYEYLGNCGLTYRVKKSNLHEVFEIQIKARNRKILLIEEVNSNIVSGFLTVELHRMGRRMNANGLNIIGHISEIYVSPEFRDGGRARALLKKAEYWSRESGAFIMECEVLNRNKKGLEFWNEVGYQPQYQIFNKAL